MSDILTALVAASLPWSTSATSILLGLWLVAFIPSLDITELRRTLATPAGGLPVLLWAVALVGMVWAVDISTRERLRALGGFHKLLFIPLLITHFRRSEGAAGVLKGFMLSCLVLLVLSWTMILLPGLSLPISTKGGPGVPVKDYISQGGEFTVAAFILAALGLQAWRDQRRWLTIASLVGIIVLLTNNYWATTSRTSLVIAPLMLLLFAAKHLSRKGSFALFAGAAILAMTIWILNSSLRLGIADALNEVREFQPDGARTRAGERIIYWKKSLTFIAEAPVIGHGTGSIPDQFRRAAVGKAGMDSLATSNPHNQTFGVAIQFGNLGTSVLFAMWIAHLLLMFGGAGFAAWAGIVVVMQNIVGSLFNSHLMDFTQGWGYVLGVGVVAGVLSRTDGRQPARTDELRSAAI